MKLNQSPTRQKYPLSKRKILKKTLPGALFFGFIFLPATGIAIALGFAASNISTTLSRGAFFAIGLAILLAYLLIVFLIWAYQRWYFATYYYSLEDHFIAIKKGPITPHEINVPFQRIQDVYIDQDILDRLLGLYDLHLSSATASSGMAAHIDGLPAEAASAFRDELLETIHQKLTSDSNGPA